MSLQFSSSQLQRGTVHRPIRVQERTLDFSVAYPKQRYEEMEELSKRIQRHYVYALGSNSPAAMTLYYWALDRHWDGFIEQVERGDQRFKSAYTRQFRMRLISFKAVPSNPVSVSPFTPTGKNVTANPTGWFKVDPVAPAVPGSGALR